MKQLLILALSLFNINSGYAQSDIYVCVDANGVKSYGNVGDGKGCQKVDLPGLTVIPAPATKRVAKAPNDFPKVDNTTQKNRDSERKQILEDELKAEQKKMDELSNEYKNGQPDRQGSERNYAKYQERVEEMKANLNRTQQNVDAIQREINNLN